MSERLVTKRKESKRSHAQTTADSVKFYRPADVTRVYGIARTTIFRWVREGKLPEPNRISARVVGWDKATLDEIFLK